MGFNNRNLSHKTLKDRALTTVFVEPEGLPSLAGATLLSNAVQ